MTRLIPDYFIVYSDSVLSRHFVFFGIFHMSCHLAVIYIHNVETDCTSFILPENIIFGLVTFPTRPRLLQFYVNFARARDTYLQ